MPGLSRRAFLATVGGLAAAWSLPRDLLGSALAQPMVPSATASTTVQQTIRAGARGNNSYRLLIAAGGEPYHTRVDLLGRAAGADRAKNRRSLLYLAHLTDNHVMDAQSPARLEPMAGQSHTLWAGAMRPQDALTVHVMTAMVGAIGAVMSSPVTGAPLAAALNTGDSADMLSSLELQWYIGVLDGATITPNSGAAGIYEGVQMWDDTPYAYHPNDPSGDVFGAYGFPQAYGMLTAAVSMPVTSPGLPVPWYAVYGNHDTLLLGTLGVDSQLQALAVGPRKAAQWEPLALDLLDGLAANASPLQRALNGVLGTIGWQPGVHAVTPDPARKLFDQKGFMQAHLSSPALPGPVGHGFTQANVDNDQTYWKADLSGSFRAFGLDTCNQVAGPDGAVPESQFEWLKSELAAAQADKKMAVVLSHHNSFTLENGAEPALRPGEKLYHADEFVAMLAGFPNVVAWLNGHTHINTITAHANSTGTGGFWEITAASCIDFPQQQQLVEFVDNRDGTLSIFTTALDHDAPAAWSNGDYSATALASFSREMSFNDWVEDPPMRLGSPLDRNTELLLPAPFDLSTITDATLEQERAGAQARIAAYQGRQPK